MEKNPARLAESKMGNLVSLYSVAWPKDEPIISKAVARRLMQLTPDALLHG